MSGMANSVVVKDTAKCRGCGQECGCDKKSRDGETGGLDGGDSGSLEAILQGQEDILEHQRTC
ncbi:MAG: hypothetical protein WC244_00025 [Patescibacteria group bacterium]